MLIKHFSVDDRINISWRRKELWDTHFVWLTARKQTHLMTGLSQVAQ